MIFHGSTRINSVVLTEIEIGVVENEAIADYEPGVGNWYIVMRSARRVGILRRRPIGWHVEGKRGRREKSSWARSGY
jgi:hypothetical protein